MQTTITADTANPKPPTKYHRKTVGGMMLLAGSYIKSEQHDHYKLTILLSDVIQVYTLNVNLSKVILLIKFYVYDYPVILFNEMYPSL